MDLGQVFTDRAVAAYMASMFEVERDALILDPCFGAGVFLEMVMQRGFTNVEGYEIDKELYKNVKVQYPKFRLYNSDFLKVAGTRRYDGIIMNPPYIRQEKIDDLKQLGITKAKLRKNKIYKKLPGSANMYMYFIFKALDLLKEDGELVVIFPSSWMDARGGEAFQKVLNSCATIMKQVHISGDVFEKSALVEVIILKLKKGKIEHKTETIYLETRDGSMRETAKTIDCGEVKFDIPFSRYASVRRGLTTGCNAMYINPSIKEEEKLEMDYVIRNIHTQKYLCVIEVKRTPADVQSTRYQIQAQSYVQMNHPQNEKPFYVLTNLEKLISFRYDTSKPRVYQQMLAPGMESICDFSMDDESTIVKKLAAAFAELIDKFKKSTLDQFLSYMNTVAADDKRWKSSMAMLMYEYIRGAFRAVRRSEIKYDIRKFHDDVEQVCIEANKVDFDGIFAYDSAKYLPLLYSHIRLWMRRRLRHLI